MSETDRAELFQVGDRVRITKPDAKGGTSRFPSGTVGQVSQKFRDHYEVVAAGDFWFYSDHELSGV